MSNDEIGTLNFETALGQLDEVISTLESGQVPLDEAVNAYERGIKLSRHCEDLLDKTDARITRLVQGEYGTSETEMQVGADGGVAIETGVPRARRAAPKGDDPGLFPGVSATRPRVIADPIDPDDIPF